VEDRKAMDAHRTSGKRVTARVRGSQPLAIIVRSRLSTRAELRALEALIESFTQHVSNHQPLIPICYHVDRFTQIAGRCLIEACLGEITRQGA